MNFTRRRFITSVLASTSLLAAHTPIKSAECQRVNGSGSYALGPFEALTAGDPPVYLITDLGFDETMIFCKVTTNFAALKFGTARMGVIDLGAHEFFMDMQSETIDSMTITQDSDGPVVNFTGVLRSETRVFSGSKMQIFVEDHISFGCEALSLSPEAVMEVSKTNFSMTARFNPTREHAAIFGDEATFAGRLTRGNIVIL